MIVTPIKTDPIQKQQHITDFLDAYIPPVKEKSVVVITSKVVSILEGSVVPHNSVQKDTLIQQEADWYLPRSSSKYNVMLTLKRNILIAAAGIDESNGDDHYVLWPKDPYKSAQEVWDHLRQRDSLQELGVIITDSRNTPTRWGAIGVGIAWCGFEPLNNYIGTPDIFGRKLVMTKSAILDGLAAAAVLCMGEGNEQTPAAIIQDLSSIHFVDHPPTKEEIDNLHIDKEDDVFAPLINQASWIKGKASKDN